MTRSQYFGGVLVLIALGIATAAASGSENSGAQVSRAQAIEAAQELAERLAESPEVDGWVGESERKPRVQSDVNQMAYYAAVLANELSNGKGAAETRPTYEQLQQAGLRILRGTRAHGEQMPAADLDAYRRLMTRLQQFYGTIEPGEAR